MCVIIEQDEKVSLKESKVELGVKHTKTKTKTNRKREVTSSSHYVCSGSFCSMITCLKLRKREREKEREKEREREGEMGE